MPNLMSAAMRLARLLFGAMLACGVCNESVCAQTTQQVAPTRAPMPDNAKLTLLIQMHIAALSQANLTGNYSVLHALGSPAFQAVNSPRNWLPISPTSARKGSISALRSCCRRCSMARRSWKAPICSACPDSTIPSRSGSCSRWHSRLSIMRGVWPGLRSARSQTTKSCSAQSHPLQQVSLQRRRPTR